MRSLRGRLFAAILGTVLLAVGVSLTLGVVLTRDAVRNSLAKDLARQADVLAQRLSLLPARVPLIDPRYVPPPARPGAPGAIPPPLGALRSAGRPETQPPPPEAPPGADQPRVVTLAEASRLLPPTALAKLRAGHGADGTAQIRGARRLFSARPLRSAVILLTRPTTLGWGDYNRYLAALLAASAVAAALAAAAAVLLARRLSAPIKRVADATRALASGRSPVPLPSEGAVELASLSEAFNEMAAQLARAREAERAVLMSVSHELRTPLTAIRGYAEGLEDGTIEAAAAAEVVGREAGRLERLVQDLLALARLEQGVLEVHREPVDLCEVAEDVERRLLPQAQMGGVTLRVESADHATAFADHDRTVQVLSNLVENAIRVSPTGGTVTIAVAPNQLSVVDTGPGICPEDLPHAFERFHLRNRNDRASPDGAGLGLAIVGELTEAMGGTVAVWSEPGRGAEFTVALPSVPATADA